jgi:hypothetical protein
MDKKPKKPYQKPELALLGGGAIANKQAVFRREFNGCSLSGSSQTNAGVCQAFGHAVQSFSPGS